MSIDNAYKLGIVNSESMSLLSICVISKTYPYLDGIATQVQLSELTQDL